MTTGPSRDAAFQGDSGESGAVIDPMDSVSVFTGQTADEVWCSAANAFRSGSVPRQQSRAGATRELLHSMFVIAEPRQRWIASRSPAINPAFAIAEVIWILAGRNDSAFLNFFNPKLPSFAGEGQEYHGAYGHRLRRASGVDQLARVTSALAANPDSRQGVLQIWDAERDLPSEDGSPASPDVPCNLLSMLKVRSGRLDWTQVLRSNDLVLGVPHNIVQFTTLQEVVAGWLGVEVGQYIHLSDSLHVYDRDYEAVVGCSKVALSRNTDSLALPLPQSQLAWRALEVATDRLVAPDLTSAEFDVVMSETTMPLPFKNMLYVLGADSARRRRWPDQVSGAVARCTNGALQQMWSRWASRVDRSLQT